MLFPLSCFIPFLSPSYFFYPSYLLFPHFLPPLLPSFPFSFSPLSTLPILPFHIHMVSLFSLVCFLPSVLVSLPIHPSYFAIPSLHHYSSLPSSVSSYLVYSSFIHSSFPSFFSLYLPLFPSSSFIYLSFIPPFPPFPLWSFQCFVLQAYSSIIPSSFPSFHTSFSSSVSSFMISSPFIHSSYPLPPPHQLTSEI